MAIKRNVAISLVLTYFVPTVLVGWILFSKVLDNFEKVEVQVMHERVESFRRDYDRDIIQLTNTARDWGQYDEPVRFIQNQKDRSILSWLLSPAAYQNTNINLVAFVSLKGKVVFSSRLSSDGNQVDQLAGEEKLKLENLVRGILPDVASTAQTVGVVTLDEQPHQVAIVPIYPIDYSGTARGFFVMIREIGNPYLKRLITSASLNASIRKFSEIDKNPNSEVSILKNELKGALTLLDPRGSPAYLVELIAPRQLFMDARLQWHEYLLFLITFVAVAVGASYLLLNSTVVNRLKTLEKKAREIAKQRDFSARVAEEGSEEFVSLSRSLNSMLKGLEDANHELSLARDQAENANKAKTSFISKVSHELRTPISTIIGNLRFLSKQEMSHEVRNRLGVMGETSEGLLGVVNDILDFADLSNNHVSVSKRLFKLKDLLFQIGASEIPRWMKDKEVLLTIEASKNIPDEIEHDKERLKQIFNHLLSNAIKFTSKGSVRCTVTRLSSQLIISVSDTGVGMDQRLLEQLTEPFMQLEETSNRKHDGLGLGFTLIRRIVSAMDGNIKINSTLGVGTQIQVLIPNVLLEGEEQHSSELISIYSNTSNTTKLAKTKLSVLVADGAALNRVLIKNMLEESGHEVLCAKDGIELLETLQTKPFDLILADFNMSGHNGMEAVRLARASGVEAPIIVLTASVTTEQEAELKNLGGNGFLMKPIAASKLDEIVQQAIAKA